MPGFNRVILMGNLTRNPEIRYTPSGTAVADLRLAINEYYKSKTGETVEKTCFVDVVAWDRQAETASNYLRKGSPVLVEGRLQMDQWETQQGEKRSKLRVRADRIVFLGSPGQDTQFSAAPAQQSSDQPSGESSNPDKMDDDDVPF